MKPRPPSLQRRLIWQPLLINLVTLLAAFGILIAVLIRFAAGGNYAEDTITGEVAKAIVRHPDGGLGVEMTASLRAIESASQDLWFVARDPAGQRVSHGQVPPEYASLVDRLDQVSWGSLRGSHEPYRLSAVIHQETSRAGPLTIIGHGKLTPTTDVIALASNLAVLPIILAFALVSLITTPWIVRRALAGVARAAQEAERIDVDRRGNRLSEHEVPREIAPLVRAVNEALGRLDEGYRRQQRFIASAAHELRTPVAILRMKIDTATDEATQRLSADVARLANLAEQLLDLQRLDHEAPDQRVDLAALARSVVADLAPLLIAAGKTIELRVSGTRPVTAHAGAIERVLTNLVQNAVEHGGQRVTVTVEDGAFEVEDDGPGIPHDERERVFEAFHRLKPRSTGTGLGLSLVRQVVERHHGRVVILDAAGGGSVFRVTLPVA